MNCTPCLPLWERWLSEAKTERGNKAAIPSQSPSVTALPEGEPRGCTDTLHLLLYDHPSKYETAHLSARKGGPILRLPELQANPRKREIYA